MATVKINHDGLNKLRARAGVIDDKDLANRMSINPGTLHRVLSGKSDPGNRFIGGALQTFGHAWFNELFIVVSDEAMGSVA